MASPATADLLWTSLSCSQHKIQQAFGLRISASANMRTSEEEGAAALKQRQKGFPECATGVCQGGGRERGGGWGSPGALLGRTCWPGTKAHAAAAGRHWSPAPAAEAPPLDQRGPSTMAAHLLTHQYF